MNRSPYRWPVKLLCILASAGAYFLSTGLHPVWPLTWVAPIPVLILGFRSSVRAAATAAFLAYALGSLNILAYLMSILPPGVIVIVIAVPALFFTLSVLFSRYAVRTLPPWVSVWAFPAAWTSYEYLLSILSPHGTFGSLAYTQVDFLPLIQVVSWTGIWGIVFLLTLFPSGIAVFWHSRRQKKAAVIPTGIVISLCLLAVIGGWISLLRPDSSPSLRVGLAVTDNTVRYFRTSNPDEALPVVREYARRINQLALQGASVAVLPEKFVGVAADYAGEVFRILGQAARDDGVTVVAGLNLLVSPRSRNSALVFSPQGTVILTYDKVHLLPGIESGYRSGKEPGVFSLAQVLAGVAICKDMDFPDWIRLYAKAGVRVMLVPAWDFVVDARLHARMAVLRAVEGGFALVRTAQQGLLTVSDCRGRIVSEEKSSRDAEVLMVTSVSPGDIVNMRV